MDDAGAKRGAARERVTEYYARCNGAYLRHMGTTFQAGLVAARGSAAPYDEHNRYTWQRAALESGMRLLDAGCGVCGPAIAFAAGVPGLSIEAVTLCPEQAALAAEAIRARGLAGRIRVQVADYRDLPFGDASFDRVVFLESLCHAGEPEPAAALAEARRVLGARGRLYIKDLFRRAGPLDAVRAAKLAAFEREHALVTLDARRVAETLRGLGFAQVEVRDLTGIASARWMVPVIFEQLAGGGRRLTEWGRLHHVPEQIEDPLADVENPDSKAHYFGEVLATLP